MDKEDKVVLNNIVRKLMIEYLSDNDIEIIYRKLNGETYKDIGDSLNITASGARQKYFVAIQKLGGNLLKNL